MLSNTAVPIYYGKFRESVLRGEIEVNEYVAMNMARIDKRIANPGIYYDDKAIDGFIAFCENELTLTDGSDVKLLDTFKLWSEDLLSWFYFEERYVPITDEHGRVRKEKLVIKKRLITKQFLIVPRGNAKTMYLSFLQNYFLNVYPKTTQQMTTAPTMKQAEQVLMPIRTSIMRARGPYFQFLTSGSLQNTTGSLTNRVKLASTKKGIQNFVTGSILEIVPLSINKIQGRLDKVATVDEWLSGDLREDPIAAIEQGAQKNGDYVIVSASSEGTVRNGPGDSIKMELIDILRDGDENGAGYGVRTSVWYYRLDDISEVSDPNKWIKACPNIGKTVSYDTYMLDVERAEKSPAARNDILAKRFNIPMEGYTYFFPYEETKIHRHRSFDGMPCALGGDLSQGDDFCAFTLLFPLQKGQYGVKTRSYITELKYRKLHPAMQQKYDEFIKEGTLIVIPGSILLPKDVYDDVDKWINDHNYNVMCFGYDPAYAGEFVEMWKRDWGPFGVEKVRQGSLTESVPLGELKAISEERDLLFDEEIMSFAMGNCVTIEDTNGNRKLCKKRRSAKIDNVAALMDAWVAYKAHIEQFEE